MVPLPPGELILFDAQNGSTITAPPGELLIVRLTAEPSTGYAWRITSGPPGVIYLGQSYDANRPMPRRGHIPPLDAKRLETSRPEPARQGQQVLRLRVQGRAGQTLRLGLAYTRANARMTLAKVYRVRIKVAAGRS